MKGKKNLISRIRKNKIIEISFMTPDKEQYSAE